MSKRLASGLIALALVGAIILPARAATVSDVFERVSAAVVVVRTSEVEVSPGARNFTEMAGTGSGVLVTTDGKVLTAAHLVQAASKIGVEFDSGFGTPARVVSSAPGADIALLQLETVPPDAVAVRLANSDKARIGDQVFVVGAPFGLSHTLTVGHLSGRVRTGRTTASLEKTEFLETDAAINRGNSGGPMFNMDGDVLGIVSFFLSNSGSFEGLGFATAANVARDLIEHGAPWSGIDGMFLTNDMQEILNVPGPGILVQRVAPNSIGERLGLRGGFLKATLADQTVVLGGDVILKVQDVPVGEARPLREQLRKLKPGDTVAVTILRAGHVQQLSAALPK